ncbi:MAG: hypothetical protein KAJ93_07795 [Methanosarcinales archaeon]|nr:hypothetical protein [Methanosarcinales archaeon]
MKAINYIAKVLPDGHLSLPEDIKKEMGLIVNSTVKITLEKKNRKDEAIRAFGVWSERTDIKNGTEYIEKIRTGWNKRSKRIDNA